MKTTNAFGRNHAIIIGLMICIVLVYGCRKEATTANALSRTPQPTAVKPENESSGVATDWYRLQTRILLERNSALNGMYFGYIGIGLYEAIRPGIKGSMSLSSKLYQMPAMPAPENNNGYSWVASANAALAAMVRSFYGGLTAANNASIDSLEAAYNARLLPGMGSAVFERSQAYGRSIATAMHDWFLTDNYNPGNTGFVFPTPFPGSWVPTPPANVPVPVNPYASMARPFMMEHLTAIAPKFPLTYDETPGSPFYNMVKQVYDETPLTQAKKDTALFWVDQGNGIGYTPPGHDFLFVTQALEQMGANLALAAEAYAKAGIAERDATIVCFRSKYDNFLLRPVTYIQKVISPGWLPFIATPPHPEYPAAHAFITGAVMEAVASVIGNDHTVTDHSYDFRGFAPITFSTIFGAGENAGISRLYGGIHYLPSINEGLRQAKIVGGRVGAIDLK